MVLFFRARIRAARSSKNPADLQVGRRTACWRAVLETRDRRRITICAGFVILSPMRTVLCDGDTGGSKRICTSHASAREFGPGLVVLWSACVMRLCRCCSSSRASLSASTCVVPCTVLPCSSARRRYLAPLAFYCFVKETSRARPGWAQSGNSRFSWLRAENNEHAPLKKNAGGFLWLFFY